MHTHRLSYTRYQTCRSANRSFAHLLRLVLLALRFPLQPQPLGLTCRSLQSGRGGQRCLQLSPQPAAPAVTLARDA